MLLSNSNWHDLKAISWTTFCNENYKSTDCIDSVDHGWACFSVTHEMFRVLSPSHKLKFNAVVRYFNLRSFTEIKIHEQKHICITTIVYNSDWSSFLEVTYFPFYHKVNVIIANIYAVIFSCRCSEHCRTPLTPWDFAKVSAGVQ